MFGALIVVLLLAVLGGNLFSPSHWHKDFKVQLGLDLSSGTEVAMLAKTPNGSVPSAQEMNETISIITSRVNGSGNSGATVQTQGSNIVNVSVPGATTSQVVQLVSTTALLRFRQVLLTASGATTTSGAAPSASASPGPSASSSASASPSSSPKASSSPTPKASGTTKTSAKIVPAASPSASASAGTSPKATSSASAHASATPSASASPSASAAAP